MKSGVHRISPQRTPPLPPPRARILTFVFLLFGTNSGDEQTQYLISAALIVSGITSIIQVMQVKIPKTNIVIGTGLVSVMGTSFTFLPVARDAISQASTACTAESDRNRKKKKSGMEAIKEGTSFEVVYVRTFGTAARSPGLWVCGDRACRPCVNHGRFCGFARLRRTSPACIPSLFVCQQGST